MTKKTFIKLLLKTYGLKPFNVEKYKQNKEKGWRGKGLDENGDVVISFDENTGFKAVVSEIITQARSAELSISTAK
jgi:hypothetical protein